MNITKDLSEKINILRILLMMNIVFIHGTMISPKNGIMSNSFYMYIQNFFSLIVPSSCVPTFFVLSGFLLFNKYDGSMQEYFNVLKKKSKSLFLPYILWNILIFMVYTIGPEIPIIADYFDNNKLVVSNNWELIDVICGITTSPLVYQFWFIKHLIIYTLFLPLLYYVLKKNPYMTLLSLFLLIWLGIGGQYSCEIFFFVFGGYLSRMDRLPDISFRNKNYLFVTLLFVIISFLRLFHLLDHGTAGIMLGIVVFFCMADLLWRLPISRKFLLFISPASFFLFAAHGVVIVFLRKSYLHFTPFNSYFLLIGYVTCSMVCIIVCIMSFFALRKLFPKSLKILCGGRLV